MLNVEDVTTLEIDFNNIGQALKSVSFALLTLNMFSYESVIRDAYLYSLQKNIQHP